MSSFCSMFMDNHCYLLITVFVVRKTHLNLRSPPLFLNQSKNVEALKAVLQNPLQGCRDKRLKDKVVQLVVRVLTAFKASDIEKGVNALDSQTLDILMKYIYRGFEFPSEGSSAALLSWHEKVYAKGGAGCIIRVLTDRKSVWCSTQDIIKKGFYMCKCLYKIEIAVHAPWGRV